jgi:hypothetical protein
LCQEESCVTFERTAKINPDELSQLEDNNTKVKVPNTDILKDNGILEDNNNNNNNTSNEIKKFEGI